MNTINLGKLKKAIMLFKRKHKHRSNIKIILNNKNDWSNNSGERNNSRTARNQLKILWDKFTNAGKK